MRPRPLIRRQRIARRVVQLGRAIGAEHAGRSLRVVVLLDGAAFFAADLLRHVPAVDLSIRYLRARSYRGEHSDGVVQREDLADWHGEVLLVDDILDTGRTLSAVADHARERGATSVESCVLCDKPSRRVLPIEADHVGFAVPDRFVVGYGLDLDGRYRELPDLCVLE